MAPHAWLLKFHDLTTKSWVQTLVDSSFTAISGLAPASHVCFEPGLDSSCLDPSLSHRLGFSETLAFEIFLISIDLFHIHVFPKLLNDFLIFLSKVMLSKPLFSDLGFLDVSLIFLFLLCASSTMFHLLCSLCFLYYVIFKVLLPCSY